MEEADKPIAALLRDLKDRGLLDDTVVIFCGEFGRTSYCEGGLTFANYGRDHHQLCGGLLLIGGGFRGGFAYGETDDWGWDVVKDPVHVHDVQATVLHALGLDHLKTRYALSGPRLPPDGRGGERGESAPGIAAMRWGNPYQRKLFDFRRRDGPSQALRQPANPVSRCCTVSASVHPAP